MGGGSGKIGFEKCVFKIKKHGDINEVTEIKLNPLNKSCENLNKNGILKKKKKKKTLPQDSVTVPIYDITYFQLTRETVPINIFIKNQF